MRSLFVTVVLLVPCVAQAQKDACAGVPRYSLVETWAPGDAGGLRARRVDGLPREDDAILDIITAGSPASVEWSGYLDGDPYVDAILYLGGCGSHDECERVVVAGCADGSFRLARSAFGHWLRPSDEWRDGSRVVLSGEEYACPGDVMPAGITDVPSFLHGSGYVVGPRPPVDCGAPDEPPVPPRPRHSLHFDVSDLPQPDAGEDRLIYSRDGALLLVAGPRSAVLDLRAERAVVTGLGPATAGAWAPDGRSVYLGDARGGVRRVAVRDARPMFKLEHVVGWACGDLAASPDGRRLVVVSRQDGSVASVDAARGAVLQQVSIEPTHLPWRGRIDDDGRVVVARSDGSLRFVDAGGAVTAREPTRRRALAVTFGATPELARAIDPASGWTWDPPRSRWLDVESPDGEEIITYGPQGLVASCGPSACRVSRWLVPPPSAVAAALAGRPLSSSLASVASSGTVLDAPWTDTWPEGRPAALAISPDRRALHVLTTNGYLVTLPLPRR